MSPDNEAMVSPIVAVVRPDPDAWFEALFQAHARAVFRYFARRVPHDDVEDLTADVFATAWRRRDTVPDDEGALPWLYRTAGFLLANFRRKVVPAPLAELPEGSGSSDAEDPAIGLIEDQGAREALSALSIKDRRILLLVAWEGLTGDELADVLGISRGGADAALSRARARLREAWPE